MSIKKFGYAIVAISMLAGLAGAQDQAQNSSATTIKHVPVKSTSPASGKEMFTSYCAVCHGKDGKGDGPAASALKTQPADLTMLSKNAGGKFPAMKISSAIRGDSNVSAHGTKDMPIWGTIFREMSQGRDAEVQQRISNLTKYVESLQQK